MPDRDLTPLGVARKQGSRFAALFDDPSLRRARDRARAFWLRRVVYNAVGPRGEHPSARQQTLGNQDLARCVVEFLLPREP